jgi:O-antigen/teichoic acid export membrane protein
VREVSDTLPVTTEDGKGLRQLARTQLRRLGRTLRHNRGEEAAFVVSNAIVNVANFGFFVVVSRLFSASSYGAITALLSIVTVANTPLNAIQAGVVHATVVVRQAFGTASPRRVVGAFAAIGLAVTVVVAAASILVQRFFTLPNVFPVLMLALWFAPSVINSALCGTLMGHFKFRSIAVANVVGAVARIALVVAFGAAGHLFGLSGPIVATSAGVAVSTTWIFVAARRESNWRSGAPLELHLSHTLFAFFSLAGYASFIAIDVVLARHLLLASVAGNYAAASTAGKIALFLSVAVPIVAYPRFAAHHAASTDARHDLLYAFVIVIVLGVLAAGVMALFPNVTVLLLFGHRYATAAPILRLLAPEGAAMGVVGLFTYYHVAQRSIWALLPWLGVLAVTLTTTMGHLSAHGLAVLMVITATLISALMALPELPTTWLHRATRIGRIAQPPTR